MRCLRIKEEVAKYSTLGSIILCGDFNARTGDLQEKFRTFDDDIAIIGSQIIIEKDQTDR